jgi:hypothetical protein
MIFLRSENHQKNILKGNISFEKNIDYYWNYISSCISWDYILPFYVKIIFQISINVKNEPTLTNFEETLIKNTYFIIVYFYTHTGLCLWHTIKLLVHTTVFDVKTTSRLCTQKSVYTNNFSMSFSLIDNFYKKERKIHFSRSVTELTSMIQLFKIRFNKNLPDFANYMFSVVQSNLVNPALFSSRNLLFEQNFLTPELFLMPLHIISKKKIHCNPEKINPEFSPNPE